MGLKAPAAVPTDMRTFTRWCRETEIDFIIRGTGSPEGVHAAPIGYLYLRRDGSSSTTLYVKTADDGEATGWTAK
jgi:hypothetical protein